MARRVIRHVGDSEDILDKLKKGAVQHGITIDNALGFANQERVGSNRPLNDNIFHLEEGSYRLFLLERKINELVDRVNECCSDDNRNVPIATPILSALARPVYRSEPSTNTRRRSVRNNRLSQEASRRIGNTVLRGTNNSTRRNTGIPEEAFLRMGEVLHQNSGRNRNMRMSQQQIDELDDQQLDRLHGIDIDLLSLLSLDKLLPPNVSRKTFYSVKKNIDEHRTFKETNFNDEIEVYRNMTTRRLIELINQDLITRTPLKNLIFKVVEILRRKRYAIRQKFKSEKRGLIVIENRPELEKEYEFLEKKSP